MNKALNLKKLEKLHKALTHGTAVSHLKELPYDVYAYKKHDKYMQGHTLLAEVYQDEERAFYLEVRNSFRVILETLKAAEKLAAVARKMVPNDYTMDSGVRLELLAAVNDFYYEFKHQYVILDGEPDEVETAADMRMEAALAKLLKKKSPPKKARRLPSAKLRRRPQAS